MAKLTEISRSFSAKLNIGGFETRDFFCARKEECFVEDAEETSRRLFAFCKAQVYQDIREYKASQKARLRMVPKDGMEASIEKTRT